MWVLVFVAALFTGATGHGGGSNSCIDPKAQESCAECIASGPRCAWCASETYNQENRLRCDTRESHAQGNCDTKSIQFPTDNNYKDKNQQNLRDADGNRDAVQIYPQRIRARIRPNKPMRIPVVFRQAANYPVDLYYLMDLSNSMEDDKDNLGDLGNTIAQRMVSITKNFQLGFGSFVDKVVSPFVSIIPSKLTSPCYTRQGDACEAPYGFKNQLKLDSETNKFSAKVKQASVSGNLDAPEGGFDAIMQAVVCDDEIGWRNFSRRMLVFSTDSGFHHAGDGKLGGIVTPNDGKCHMKDGLYTESSYFDYPSVSQLANKIKEKSVNVIFAVTEDQVPIYEPLSRIFDGITGELANDSSNIVNLIHNNYKAITSKVKLRAQNVGENMTVTFYSRCFGTEEEETDECKGVKINDTVAFGVVISVSSCPKNRKEWKKELVIKPVGYQETLVIEVDLICECECEKPENAKLNSESCSFHGTLVCGQCACSPEKYGKECECETDNEKKTVSDDECIAPNATIACSGQGTCHCGKCTCSMDPDTGKKNTGTFCDCDNYSCSMYDNDFCGGEKRGVCKCGACNCTSRYSGSDCSCDLSLENCETIDMASNKMVNCSGHGYCDCGKCICDADYSGTKCEKCPLCSESTICRELFDKCVLCEFDGNGKNAKKCPAGCPSDIEETEDEVTGDGDKIQCRVEDDKNCIVYYTYEQIHRDVIIRVQKGRVCPEALNVLAIVLGVVGGIVAVGLLLLLIWKLLAFMYDQREFAKFEAERQNAKWDTGENPIYKQATSTFKNPTYGSH